MRNRYGCRRRTAAGRLGLLPALTLLLAGCTVGPEYVRPELRAPVPETYSASGVAWKGAVPGDRISRGDWWTFFGNEELDRLEAEALAASPRLEAVAARMGQARAVVDIARSGLFPRVGAGAAATRQHDSAERPLAATGEAAGRGYTYPTFTVPFDLSWEPDLWGRVRRQGELALSREEAAAAGLESARLVLTAEVAASWVAIRTLDAERALLSSTVERQSKLLEVVRSLRASGLVSDRDVAVAETSLRAQESLLPGNALARARFEHALAVLLGRSAPAFHLAEGGELPETPPILPGIPSELLERRPDVAAAERRVAAANAEVGIAHAAFYPSFRIGLLGGAQSIDAGTLLEAPARLWALGVGVSAPLFEGGRRRASLRGAEAAWEESVALYRETVLRGLAEVEDNLAAQRLLAEEYDSLAAAAASANEQVRIARERQGSGLASALPTLNAEAAARERERAVARSRGQRLTATIALIKSLGGGWQGLAPASDEPGASSEAPAGNR